MSRRIAARFESRWLQGYVSSKLRTDPVYEAVYEQFRSVEGPIIDIGCGMGLLAFYLREKGVGNPIVGIDFDERKLEAARRAASGYADLEFRSGDARVSTGIEGNVALLDVLHYFSDGDQQLILKNASAAASRGGVVVVRECLKDASWRFKVTVVEEKFARAIRWLRGDMLNFPTGDSIAAEFRTLGFSEEIVPMWGRTPFNNHFLTFSLPHRNSVGSGATGL